jgi:phosphoglycerate dehydrogenase-like enzyme
MKNPAIVLIIAAISAPLYADTKKIVVTGMPEAIAEFQSVSPGVTVVDGSADQKKLLEQVADADAIFGTINPTLFRAAKKLKWVQIYSAGVETYRFPEFINSNVVLTNCKILQGPNIADHAFSLLLALTRSLNYQIPDRTKEEWPKMKDHHIELRGKTAVIIGVGGIGSQIAQRAHAFGMTVIGVDPKEIPLNPYVSKMVFPDRLDSVLPMADVVFISAPHTPQSEGMMGWQRRR